MKEAQILKYLGPEPENSRTVDVHRQPARPRKYPSRWGKPAFVIRSCSHSTKRETR